MAPNGSRLSCGRLARRRKAVGRQSVPRQGHNTPVPLKRSPPASFKRLLGARVAEPTLEVEPSDSEEDKANKQQEGSREATCSPPQEYPVETPSL